MGKKENQWISGIKEKRRETKDQKTRRDEKNRDKRKNFGLL
jgi:hypothetical protein